MAASYHVRSNSLPSAPHSFAAHVDEQLCRFRSSESTSTSSSSIIQNLNGLQDLHNCIEKMLHLPLAQDSLSQDQNKKAVDELLEESLRLLDLCSTAKDALSQTKDSLNEIQSVLRRKREDVSIFKKYLNSRRTLKKTVQKLLKSLKTSKNMSSDETLTMLEEAQEITAIVFGSLLCFISGSNTQSKKSGKWSLVSKLVSHKRIACEQEADANEFARADVLFQSFIDNKSEKTMKIEDVQSLEMCIQDLEENLESLFKSLIKVRVSVLNILGN